MSWKERSQSTENYYIATEQKPPSPEVSTAISIVRQNGVLSRALDLGCGVGIDTTELARHFEEVDAVDYSVGSAARMSLNTSPNLHFHNVSFEEATLPGHYNLVYSRFALPFCDQKFFPQVWDNIYGWTTQQGILAVQLLGESDQWNTPETDINFFTRIEVDRLLSRWNILQLKEHKFKGETAMGKPKFWHYYDIIAQKA